jgi:hypothetical protein
MQYLYYKGPEKEGLWRSLDVDTLLKRIDKAPKIAFTTILSVNAKVSSKESVPDEALYQGPLYIDIDNDDIEKSIKIAKKVFAKFTKNGVKDSQIQLWASGKRGFHMMIPMSVFTKDIPLRKLPLAYKYMLGQMKVLDIIDHTVYSHGRGRMWRVANKKRIDNGAYKVGITADELRNMTPELYAQLCSQPREPIPFAPGEEQNKYLAAMFSMAYAKAQEAVKPIQVYIDPEIVEGLQGEFPPCAEALSKGENIDPDKGYNEVSTQFGKAVATFKPDEAEDVVHAFANVMEGESYNTPEKRFEHTMKAYRISARTKDYAWSCRSMLSVLKDKESPCLECPISFLLMQQDELIEEAAQEKENAKQKRNAASKAKSEQSFKLPESQRQPEFRPNGHKPSAVNGIHAPTADGSNESGNGFGGTTILRADAQPEITADNCDTVQEPDHGIESTDEELEDVAASLSDEASESEEVEAGGDNFDDPPDDDDELRLNSEGLSIDTDGYGFIAGDGAIRRISNFTLRITSTFSEWIENLGEERRSAVAAEVLIGGKVKGNVILEETAWSSKGSLIGFLTGVANAGFYGKDDDVQRIKIVLMQDIADRVRNIRRVTSVGIHRARVADQDVFTYVEPGFSFDNLGNLQTYQLAGQIPGAPKLLNTNGIPQGSAKAKEALLAMTRINSDVKIAQLIGWFCAAFLKQHIHAAYNQFPLLGCSGAAGSGKTSQATVIAYLHGADYREVSSPTSLPQASKFAVWKTIRDSMTVPRIMEEYNKSKLPRTFVEYGEVFKDCWNQFSVQRGTLSNIKKQGDNQVGAHVTEFPLSAPVVVCSEQAVTMPALVERMVQIAFSKQDLEIPGARDYFEFCKQSKKYYFDFARSAYNLAVMVKVKDVEEMIEANKAYVPSSMGDRPQFSFAVVLSGLDFFEEVAKRAGVDISERVNELRNSLYYMLKSDATVLAMVKQRSEVDIVMEKMATMAAMSESEGSIPWLLEHVHYMRVGDTLYLDGLVAHAQYRSFCHRVDNALPVIDEYGQFRTLLRGEAYLEDLNGHLDGFARDRAVIQLNLPKMAEKGIEIAAFTGSPE